MKTQLTLQSTGAGLRTGDLSNLSDQAFLDLASVMCPFVLRGTSRRFKYRTTNESVPSILQRLELTAGLNILAVSGSGIQLFEMLAMERATPGSIVGFDYSHKQIAYNYLIKAAVNVLPYALFRTYMGLDRLTDTEAWNLREAVVTDVPTSLRPYLPREHRFCQRDLKLNSLNGVRWLFEEDLFAHVKQHIMRIKFFIYEMHPANLTLNRLFDQGVFDRVYLSNVLDWLSWHDPRIGEGSESLAPVLDDVRRVTKRDGRVALCSLANRRSRVTELLAREGVMDETTVRIHKYEWHQSVLSEGPRTSNASVRIGNG